MANRQGYYNLPRFIGDNYAETDILNCFRVFIPEGDEYKQQLLALLNVAGTKAAWFTNTDEARTTRAEQWQAAYRETLAHMENECCDCEWLAECLENEEFLEALDNAIAALLNNPTSATHAAVTNITQQALGNSQGNPLSEASKNQTLNQGWETCDKNKLWGACLHAIQVLNRLNEDFLETMQALTQNQEMAAYIVGAIPLLETLPIDEAIDLANKIRSFVQEVYVAGYDLDLEGELVCDIFCLAVANDCKLTTNLLFEYFKDRALAVEGFEDVWQTALTIFGAMASWQEMVGEKVVIAMMACNMGFLTFLNSALGMDFGHFSAQANSGVPDDDWEVNCDNCEEPSEDRVPVIDLSGSCAGGGYGGQNLTDDGGGYWIIQASLASGASDYRVVIKDELDRDFVIDDVTFPATGATCIAYDEVGVGCGVDCSSPVFPAVAVSQAMWTWNDEWTVRFRMSAPA